MLHPHQTAASASKAPQITARLDSFSTVHCPTRSGFEPFSREAFSAYATGRWTPEQEAGRLLM